MLTTKQIHAAAINANVKKVKDASRCKDKGRLALLLLIDIIVRGRQDSVEFLMVVLERRRCVDDACSDNALMMLLTWFHKTLPKVTVGPTRKDQRVENVDTRHDNVDEKWQVLLYRTIPSSV